MRQRDIMRLLFCYGFQNQFGRVCVKSISLHGNLRLYVSTINKKNDKKKPWSEWREISLMCDLLIFSSRNFSYEFENLLNYFWGNDLSFFLLLIKLSGHFNLSILRISFNFKWEFFVNAKNVVVFFVVLCGANETSEFSFDLGSSSSILFLV